MKLKIFAALLLFALLLPGVMGNIVDIHATSATVEWKTTGAQRYDVYLKNSTTNFSLYDSVYVGNATGYEVRFVEYFSDSWHYARWEGRWIVIPNNATKIRYSLGGLQENTKYEVRVVANGKIVEEDSFTTLIRGSEAKKNPTAVYLSIATIAAIMLLALFIISRKDPRDARSAYLYILPALLGLALVSFYPVIYGFYLSFTDYRMGHDFSAHFVGLQNYVNIFTNPDFYLVLNTTVIWTIANVSAHVLIGLALALVLYGKRRGKSIYRTLLLLPWAIPAYISILVWRGMFDANYGLINRALGLGINWLGEFPYAFIAVLITNIWLGFPFMMMMFLGGLQGIPKELYEAADIDGFTRWQKFRHITLPMLKPVITPAVLMGFIWTFNMFNVIYLMTGGGPQAAGRFSAGQTDLLITFVYNKAFRDWMFGYAAAYSVVIFLIILAFSVSYSKFTASVNSEMRRERRFRLNKKNALSVAFSLYALVYALSFAGVISLPIKEPATYLLFFLFIVAIFATRKNYREAYLYLTLVLFIDFALAVYYWLLTDIRAYGFYGFNLLSLLDIFLLLYFFTSNIKEEFGGRAIKFEIRREFIKAENPWYPIILALIAIAFAIVYRGIYGIVLASSAIIFLAYLFLPRDELPMLASAIIATSSVFFSTYYGNFILSIPLIIFVPSTLLEEKKAMKYVEYLATWGFLYGMLFIIIVPVWYMFWISVNPTNTLFSPNLSLLPAGATFNNYIYAIQKTPFLLWLRNSLIVAGGTTILGIVLAVTAAYGYSRFDFHGKNSTLMLFLVVQMFPGVIVLIPYYLIMYNLGLVDTFIGLIIAYAVTAIPLIVWMSKGFFDSIPKSIDEAAMIDGCSRFSAFMRVVLPLATPGISVAALFSFITAWNEFVLAYTFMGEEHYTLPVGIMQFVGLTGTTSSQWGVFAAVSIMVSIPVVLVFLSLQRYLISGMTSGSVKG